MIELENSKKIDKKTEGKEMQLTIEISDNGPGFPEDQLDKVFQPFYRLQSSRTGGTGLGLSIAKGFIQAHKGTIELENRKEGGAQFRIKIPVETPKIKDF